MANTVTISASKDTYITSQYPTGNYSSSGQLKLSQPSPGVLRYVSFAGFDLTSIPRNKVITKMVLKVYFYNFYNEAQGFSWNPSGTSLNLVVRARSVSGVTLAEVDALTYDIIQGKTGINNPYGIPSDAGDGAYNVTNSMGQYIPLTILNYSKDECVAAIFCDVNYSYTGDNAIYLNSKESGSLIPQLEVTYIDYVPPKPTNLVPSSTVRNKAGEIKLSWKFEDTVMGTSQASYQLIYSKDNFSTSTTVNGTTSNFYNIPANTFTDGQTVKWKVKVTDTNGDTTDFSDIVSFTIGATTPSVPETLNPINTIVNSSDIIFFRWKFTDLYGYSQAKFDLQYKRDAEAETTVTVTTANNQYQMPVNTLSGGNYSWRVRCYNAFNEVSSYSPWVTFYSIGKPSNPEIISISNNARPAVSWHSVDQDLFILRIYRNTNIVYDGGEIPGAAISSFKLDDYLPDGNYVAGLRISNRYGFWSNETLLPFSISTTKPGKPVINGNVNSFFIALIISSGTDTNLIYRKGSKDSTFKSIATLSGNTFEDYAVPAGANQYYVRAVNETAFNDSDIISLDIRFTGIVLSGYSNQSDLINLLHSFNTDRRKVIATSKDQFLKYFNGRVYPVSQSTENKNHSETHEYFIRQDEFDTFYRISNYDTLLYRNDLGYSYIVSISNVSDQENEFGYVVGFTLTRLEE